MEVIELHFSNNKDKINNYVKNKRNNKNNKDKYIEYCIKCYKTYKWINYLTTDNEDTDEDKNINIFKNWLIKEKHWYYDWNSHMFHCVDCYVRLLEDKIKELENDRLECVIL